MKNSSNSTNSEVRSKHLEKYYKMFANELNNNNSVSFSESESNRKEYISKDPKEISQFFKEEGNKFFFRKDYDVALIFFTKAIDYDSSNKIFYSNRSACHLAKGNYRLALKDALKCLELDTNYIKAYYRASLAYFEMNQLDQAIKMLEVYKNLANNSEEEILNTPNLGTLIENIKSRQLEQKEMSCKYSSYHRFLNFTNWLHEGDTHFAKLEIEFYSDDHRGVVAKHDIYKDEVILKVPKENLISLELAKNTDLGEKIATFMYVALNSPKHCLLSSFILTERAKGADSKWKPYFDILPKDYSSFPIFYTDEELSYLEGSPFLAQVLEKRQDMKKDYEKICTYIPEFEQFDYRDFCETRMAVSSRIFGVKIDFKKTDVLAPFADLLNHKRPRTTHWYYDEKYKAFIIQSLENIPKGSEVYDSYGKKCNSRFLLNYGFVIEDNDANEFPITLQLDNTYPNFDEKKLIFSKDQEFTKTFRLSANILDVQVVDFFSYLRFLLFDGDIRILLKIIKDNQKLIFDDSIPSFFLISPINKEIEIKVLKKIEDLMILNLAKYKTTLAEDEELITKSDQNEIKLTYNQRNCILMRSSEKQILHYFLTFARYCLELFDMTEKEIKERIEEDFEEDECPYEFYIFEVLIKFNRSNTTLK